MVVDDLMENKDSSAIDFVRLVMQCLTVKNEGNSLFDFFHFIP